MTEQDTTRSRDHYGWYLPMPTRWIDNDAYGHVNNVNYYAYFDTIANTFMIEQCGLDYQHGPLVAFIVHSECHYKQSIAFPEKLEGGLRVNHLGNSSVQWGVGIFKQGEPVAAAYGTFTHVLVDRISQKPVPIPEALRQPMSTLTQRPVA